MKNYKNILIPLSLKAGDEILKFFGNNYITSKKSDNSPVTEADIAANSIIVSELQKTGLPILSEESKIADFKERKEWKEFWLVDPLDGTKQFINNEVEFTVNIALISNNQTIEGIVYVPAKKELYYGNINDGAIKIDFNSSSEIEHKLPLRKNTNIVIVASKSHLNEATKDYLNKIKEIIPDSEYFNIGSSLKLCSVAEGIADLYPRIGNISEWDIAAGHAILKASGGNIINKRTFKEVEYNTEKLETPDFLAYKDESILTKIVNI